jgi:hypothetical protein
MKPLPNETAVMDALRENIQEKGVFGFPHANMSDLKTQEQKDAFNAKYRKGPSGLLIYTPSSEKDMMTTEQLGVEFGVCVILALLSAMLLAQAAPALPSYVMRLFFVFLIGLIAGIAVPVRQFNWYETTSDFTMLAIAEQVIGFVLAGILIAAIVRHKSKAAPLPSATV